MIPLLTLPERAGISFAFPFPAAAASREHELSKKGRRETRNKLAAALVREFRYSPCQDRLS